MDPHPALRRARRPRVAALAFILAFLHAFLVPSAPLHAGGLVDHFRP